MSATVADVFNKFGDGYLEKFHVSFEQLKLMNAIRNCRTAALGGHRTACNHCGIVKVHYNSCRNRHCPACQGVNKEKWILERQHDLLPVNYFHVVFTLPSPLRSLCRQNSKLLYNLLFSCAWQTMDDFSQDNKQQLEAKMGMIAVLHTWTQKLIYHPHLHCIVPAGGIDADGQWKTTKSKGDFLFHVMALSKTFRGKFLFYLNRLYHNKQLVLEGKIKHLQNKTHFRQLKDVLYQKEWVLYAKPSFDNPNQVLEYLARYTHRIAISNYRIKAIRKNNITFSYLDRKDGNKQKMLTLTAHQFIYRLLSHVLPKRFVKIRHYGFLATRVKTSSISLIRAYFDLPQQGPKPKYTVREVLMITKGIDPDLCITCGQGVMVVFKEIPDKRGSPQWKRAC